MPVENAGNMLCHRKVMYPLLPFPERTMNKLALPDRFSTATAGMRRVNSVNDRYRLHHVQAWPPP
jgi:hypothetical protein